MQEKITCSYSLLSEFPPAWAPLKGWCPPVLLWFMDPPKYDYDHKPKTNLASIN